MSRVYTVENHSTFTSPNHDPAFRAEIRLKADDAHTLVVSANGDDVKEFYVDGKPKQFRLEDLGVKAEPKPTTKKGK